MLTLLTLYPYIRTKENKFLKITGLFHCFLFEQLIYNEVYPYLIDSNLISSHQSGFKGGDSRIN